MPALILVTIALFTAMAFQATHAQNPRVPSSPGVSTRYFIFEDGLIDDLNVDGFLTETGQGGRAASAAVDLCYPSAAGADKKDRVVVNLKAERGRLVGTAKSQVDGEQVTVNIARRQAGTPSNFEGSIKIGSDQMKVSATDVPEQNETEFRDKQPEEIKIVAAPADFTDVSADTVGFRVKRDALAELIRRLKGQDALIDRIGLDVDCTVLRTGEHVVQVQVHPERAATLIEKAKGMGGLVAAGYSTGKYPLDHAVRIAGADFRKDDKIDYDKIASTAGASAEKAFSAKLVSSTWNPTTGEFTLELTRASDVVPGAELTELLRLRGFVGPEMIGRSDNLILWIGNTSNEIVDAGPAPHVKFTNTSNDNDGRNNESTALVAKLAEELKGRTRDNDGSAWK